jgi:hypothetical protein
MVVELGSERLTARCGDGQAEAAFPGIGLAKRRVGFGGNHGMPDSGDELGRVWDELG